MRTLFACLLLASAALTGCRGGQSAQVSASANGKVYRLRGTVVSTNATKSEVVVKHEAIAGFMDAMTMPYKLRDANVAAELHPGDVLTADLVVPGDPNADSMLDHIVVVAQERADYRPAVVYHVPAPGEEVPDFALRNQDGRAIHLKEFRGKALLLTFIYTRCPLPDFCPRVTRNFAVVERRLAADGALLDKTQLLCVTFDPENDTPERLRAYGAQYIGSDAKGAFAHWDFAVPSKPVLEEMRKYFDVGLTHEADGTFTHTLSTTLVGPDGKVVKFYPGNDWTVEQVLGDVERAAGQAGNRAG
jgi:protein SCO1/2